jgi:trehalose 6-phosphate phosphatase
MSHMATKLRLPEVKTFICPEIEIDTANHALFLDIDGTLIDIAPFPSAVIVPPDLAGLLTRVQASFGGAMAIVTGRRIHEADALLAPLAFAASGVHGCEFRLEPGSAVVEGVSLDNSVVSDLHELATRHPGLLVEAKGAGAAVHYRRVPDSRFAVEGELRQMIANIWPPIQLAHGRMVFELLPLGLSKGTAIETLLEQPPFKNRIPVMIGDDVGDISAFNAARRNGGAGLTVAGEHFPSASSHFEGPAAVRTWLDQISMD